MLSMYRSVGSSLCSWTITLAWRSFEESFVWGRRRLILIANCRLRLYSALQFTSKTKYSWGKKQIILNLLSVLPISSAYCERGFSQMNVRIWIHVCVVVLSLLTFTSFISQIEISYDLDWTSSYNKFTWSLSQQNVAWVGNLYFSIQNELKLAYGKENFKMFPGVTPPNSRKREEGEGTLGQIIKGERGEVWWTGRGKGKGKGGQGGWEGDWKEGSWGWGSNCPPNIEQKSAPLDKMAWLWFVCAL